MVVQCTKRAATMLHRGRESAWQRDFLWKIYVFRLAYLFADFLPGGSRRVAEHERLIVSKRGFSEILLLSHEFQHRRLHRKREEGQRGVFGKSHDAIPRPQKRKLKRRCFINNTRANAGESYPRTNQFTTSEFYEIRRGNCL